MDGKIGLEEHFAIADTLQDSAGFLPPGDWEELSGRLIDPEDRRLREMDANGMETMVLSLNAPARLRFLSIPLSWHLVALTCPGNHSLDRRIRPDRA